MPLMYISKRIAASMQRNTHEHKLWSLNEHLWILSRSFNSILLEVTFRWFLHKTGLCSSIFQSRKSNISFFGTNFWYFQLQRMIDFEDWFCDSLESRHQIDICGRSYRIFHSWFWIRIDLRKFVHVLLILILFLGKKLV